LAKVAKMSTYPKEPTFNKTDTISDIQQVAGAMVAFGPDNQTMHVSGTCVRIASNLYLTARHVLEDFIGIFGLKNGVPNFTVWVIHTYAGPKYAIWSIYKLWLSPHSDLATFCVKPFNDIAANHQVVRTVGLDLQPPTIGSRIFSWGYHRGSGITNIDENGVYHYKVDGEGATTVGEIREYHPMGTDKALRPFACFRVNARFDGGMSGGPVFSDSGHICGVICSNLPPHDETEEHCSYVTALWPLMALGVELNPITGHLENKTCSMFELAKNGVLSVNGLEKISVSQSSIAGIKYDVTCQG
jgi:Trypsin-like peptidase domain